MDAITSPSESLGTRTGRARLFDLSHVLCFVTTLLALGFVVVLSKDNIKQRIAQARLRSELATSNGTFSGPPQAQIGDIVPPFDGLSLSGKATKVVYDNHSKYLLFIMSLDCDACLSQIPIWNSIVQKIDERECSALGLVTGGRSITIPPANFELLPIPNMSVQRAYRVAAVPAVMVVSKGGRVEWVHHGQLTANLSEDLLSAIVNKPNTNPK